MKDHPLCVLCDERAITTSAGISTCAKHDAEYQAEGARYLPFKQRVFYQRLLAAQGGKGEMMDEKQALTLAKDAFRESVKPKKITGDNKDLFLFRCDECDNHHFRHAGYLEGLMPFIRPDKVKRVDKSSYCVMVCTKCRACYIWLNEQMYDVTALIDLEAWAKAERELQQATGPGGQC